MKLKKITYSTSITIIHYDQMVKLDYTLYDGKKIYRFQWEDCTIDYLYKSEDNWMSFTLEDTNRINELVSLIDHTRLL